MPLFLLSFNLVFDKQEKGKIRKKKGSGNGNENGNEKTNVWVVSDVLHLIRHTVQEKTHPFHLYCSLTVLVNEIKGAVTKWSEFGPPTESTEKLTRKSEVSHVNVRSRFWVHFC